MHFSTLAGKHWSETNTGCVHDFDNSCIKTCACRYLVIFWPSQSSVNQWTNKLPIHLTHSYLIICLPYWITLTFNFTGPTGPSLWVPRFCEDLGKGWEATTPSGRWCETTVFLRLSEFDDVRKVRNQQPGAIWNYHAKGCKKHQQILRTLKMENSWVIYTKLTWFNWINVQHFVNSFRLLRIYPTTEVPTNHQLIRQIRIGPGMLGWLGGEASEINGCHMFIRIYSIYPQSFFKYYETSKFETFHSLAWSQ